MRLSWTQLSMYARCGWQYYLRYIEGLKVAPTINLLIGTGYHAGIEHNSRQKIESHVDLPVQEITEVAVAALESRAALEGIESYGTGKSPEALVGEGKDAAAPLALLYAVEQAPDYQPVDVERRVELSIGDHQLTVITDLVDDKSQVVDFKTSGRTTEAGVVAHNHQLTIGALSFKALRGELPRAVIYDEVVKLKKPKRNRISGVRSTDDLAILSRRLDVTIRAIESGIFVPADPAAPAAPCHWCGYRFRCKFFNHRKDLKP